MRVLLAHNFYKISGGEDIVVRDELANLKQNGIDARFFSVDNDHINGFLEKATSAVNVVYNLRSRRTFRKILDDVRPDVVHIHNFFPTLSPSIFDACRAARVPAVMTLHNFRLLSPGGLLYPDHADHDLKGPCWWTVPKKVYRNSAIGTLAVAAMIEFHKKAGTWFKKVDRFIALSTWAKAMFVAGGLPADRIVVKPNFVAPPEASDIGMRRGALFVGRLDEQKGIHVLLRAWEGTDYPLTIIGDGPLANLVQESAQNGIIYRGRQPRDVVQQEMRRAKFLVLPSLGSEMLPVTVLEAFANRLPVICSDLPALSDLVKTGVTGLTFASGDAAALSRQAQWAASNDRLMGEMARRAASDYETRYTPEAHFARIMEIYADAIGVFAAR